MEILGGAGLARHRPLAQRRGFAGAAGDGFMHQPGHRRIILRAHHCRMGAGGAGIEQLAGNRAHLEDAERRHAFAAIGEGGIGAGQLQRRHAGGAQRQRSHFVQRRCYAQPSGGGGNGARADFLGQLRRDGIGRDRKGFHQRHVALIFVLEIGRRPFADGDGAVMHDVVRRAAILEGGEIDKGLEGAAGLAHRVGGAVEAGLDVGAPAHHGAHRAVGRHRHQRALAGMKLVALRRQAAFHGRFRQVLGFQVEAGLHHHRLGAGADHAVQLRNHPVGEIAGARRGAGAHHPGPRLGGGQPCFQVDEADRFHRLQHGLGARLAGVGVSQGIVFRRRLDAARQHRRLGQAKLAGMLAEEFFRRRLDAIDPGAEIDLVEIEAEDLVLAVTGLQIDGQPRFLQLALHVAVGREKEILRQLLRQGRTTLHHMAGHHVADGGARQAHRVNAEMRAEAAVLNGDESVGDIVGQRGDRNHLALRQAAPRNQPAAIVQDGDVLRRARLHQVAHVGQAGNEMRKDHRPEDQAPDDEHGEDEGPARFAAADLLFRRRGAVIAAALAGRRSVALFGGGLTHAAI